MSAKNSLAWFISLISAIVLIMVILLTVVQQCVFDMDFFRSEYVKLDSTSVIGMSDQSLMQTTEALLAYIKGDRADLNIRAVINGQERPVFNQREITHMADVQKLYTFSHTCRNAGVVLLLLLLISLRLLTGKKYYRVWAGAYLVGAVLFIGLFGFIGIAVSQDFLAFWDRFHTVIFTNDLWLLDPATDVLIQMVPEQFFFDLVVRILIMFTGAVLILALAAGGIIARGKMGKPQR